MKTLCIVISFLSFTILSYSQDLIKTNKGREYNCKIIEEDSLYYHVKVEVNDKIIKTKIEKENVITVTPDFYSTDFRGYRVNRNKPNSRFELVGGYGYRLGAIDESLSDELQEYSEQIKHGVAFGVEYDIVFGNTYGLSFNYNLHYATATNEQHIDLDGVMVTPGNMYDKISLHYFGPGLVINSKSKSNISYKVNFAPLFVYYRDNSKIRNQEFIMKAKSAGFLFSTGFDFPVTNEFSLYTGLNLIISSTKKFTLEYKNEDSDYELEEGQRESLSLIEFVLGISLKNF